MSVFLCLVMNANVTYFEIIFLGFVLLIRVFFKLVTNP